MSENIKFKCPSCECKKLECVMDGTHSCEVIEIDVDGDHCYGEITSSAEVDRWQCFNCGYVLKDENNENVNDNLDVVEWCKKNCLQD